MGDHDVVIRQAVQDEERSSQIGGVADQRATLVVVELLGRVPR